MTEPKQQRPRGVLGGDQIGFFPWLFDQVARFITVEGDFALQFMAGFIRGPEQARDKKHLKRQMKLQTGRQNATAKKQDKPLTKSEQKIFVDVLSRHPNERQVPYWKRKKGLLNNPNKRALVLQHIAAQKMVVKQKTCIIEVDDGPVTRPTKQKQSMTKARKR